MSKKKKTIVILLCVLGAFSMLMSAGTGVMLLTLLGAIPLGACMALDDLPIATWFVDCDQMWGEYMATGGACNPTVSANVSANIPEQWRGPIDKAARAYAVNPNLLAALFLTENGNKWKALDTRWPVSPPPANAAGPMQFIPGTWESLKTDGNGDGKTDVNNVDDALHSAAKYLNTELQHKADATVGSHDKPFVPGTMTYSGAAYNQGPGEVANHTTPDMALKDWRKPEGVNYTSNIYTLLTSNLTRGSHPNYQSEVTGLDGKPVGGSRAVVAAGATTGATDFGTASAGGPTAPASPSVTVSPSSTTTPGSNASPEPTTASASAPEPTGSSQIVWPIDKKSGVSSPYGNRPSRPGGASKFHGATDFSGPGVEGQPIYAVASGTVVAAGPAQGFGQWIVLEHTIRGKKVHTWYGHMTPESIKVSTGDAVTAGQQIAAVGSEGRSTGPHLHFEVHPGGGNDNRVDPIPWLESQGATETGQQPGEGECDIPNGSGSAVIAAAEKHLGVKYSMGGGDPNGPTNGESGMGFDCSGLVLYAIYQASGGRINLPHSASAQQDGPEGKVITGGQDQWQPGDILFRVRDGRHPAHVVIYYGNGQILEAPSTGDFVKVTKLYFTPTAIKRYL